MQDTIINALRQSEGEQLNNRTLARFLWLIGSMVFLFGGFVLHRELVFPDQGSTSVVVGIIGALLLWVAIWIFVSSLVWPTLQVEAWLDEHYPDHTADPLSNYQIRRDILASASVAGLWGMRLLVGYAMILAILPMFRWYAAIADAGFSITDASVKQLTVVNSLAIGTLSVLLAGIGMWVLINWWIKPDVREFTSVSSSAYELSDRDLVDEAGGEVGA